MYRVKSCFRTIQGEGAHVGRVAVFVRMSGCNLWSGRQQDRVRSVCSFCDTDFVGQDGPQGGLFADAADLVDRIQSVWLKDLKQDSDRFVVFTGGEPLLQLDEDLIDHCHGAGFQVAVETNGTLPCPSSVDWICVSPKAGALLVQRSGHELKVVYPQPGLDLSYLATLAFDLFSLLPLDNEHRQANTAACIEYCLANPKWRLRVQTHKWLGID